MVLTAYVRCMSIMDGMLAGIGAKIGRWGRQEPGGCGAGLACGRGSLGEGSAGLDPGVCAGVLGWAGYAAAGRDVRSVCVFSSRVGAMVVVDRYFIQLSLLHFCWLVCVVMWVGDGARSDDYLVKFVEASFD